MYFAQISLIQLIVTYMPMFLLTLLLFIITRLFLFLQMLTLFNLKNLQHFSKTALNKLEKILISKCKKTTKHSYINNAVALMKATALVIHFLFTITIIKAFSPMINKILELTSSDLMLKHLINLYLTLFQVKVKFLQVSC